MTESYGYDKTPTPPRDYDVSKVPTEIKKRSTWVKTKFTGEDVAEAYGQAMEISGIYSDEAKQIAQQTKVRQDNLETQTAQSVAQMEADKNTIVANATVDSEVILARGGKATLGQRLDETTAQLAETNKPLRYGELRMPNDFTPTLPCAFYRDNDGIIKHNMDFQSRYKNGTKLYAMVEGDDVSGDGSAIKPFRTLRKAIEVAIAGVDSKYEIHTNIPVVNRAEMDFTQTITNKTIALVSEGSDKAATLVTNRYDASISALVGDWDTTHPNRPYTNTVGDSVTMSVYGEEITFGYYANSRGGIVEFTVDGRYKTTISQYAPTSKYTESMLFSDLPEGNHTIEAKFIGEDNSSPALTPARMELYVNTDPVAQPERVTYRTKYYDESKKQKHLSNKTLVTNNAPYVWSDEGNGTYSTARSGVRGVIDLFNVDLYDLPIPLKHATSPAECKAEKNTWFLDGTTLYVHRLDEKMPTQDTTVVNLAVLLNEPIIGDGGVLYFENFIFTHSRNNNALMARNITNQAVGELCFSGCGFVGQRNNGSTGNGLATENIKNVFSFDCIVGYAQKDGYNYHYLSIPIEDRRDCLVVEYNCKGYDLGLDVIGNNSNNASSAHEGVNIVRFGTVGYRNTGATIIDVNGCYSVLYDCNARTPVSHGTAFSFTSDGDGLGLGKTFMYNCGAMDCDVALNVGSTHTAYINNFKYEGVITGAGMINRI